MPIPIIDPSQAATNERLARLEAIAEQHTQALGEIKAYIARVEDRITRVEDRIMRVEDYMHKSFRWLIGLMFIAWVSAIVTILLKGD